MSCTARSAIALICRARLRASFRYAGVLLALSGFGTHAQTAFVNFNTPGQYTSNFSPWNDNGTGGSAGNYSFAENTTDGVSGGGGVSISQATDTSATYKSGSWNLATNGATMVVSTFLFANGGNGGDKAQMGAINSTTNGLNSNVGVQFETFRLVPASTTTWSVMEQYRSNNVTTTGATLDTVSIVAGHWYKFVVAMTNTSGASGNLSAGCALFDYGTSGLTPGANVITFATAQSHAALNIATNTAVWPAFRDSANAAINAWDNFLVFTTNSVPVFTAPLNNVTVLPGTSAALSILADGPGTISYAWFTNGVLVAGATTPNYTTPSLAAGSMNVAVVAANSKGSVTNQATVSFTSGMAPIVLTGFNRDLVIESNAAGPPYGSNALEFNPGEGTAFYQSGLPGTTFGLPVSGQFNSALDGTPFALQPYTGNNALVMSSETGITSGTLTLVTPGVYSSIAILANSGDATANSTGTLTFTFTDNSTFVTNYDAADWFFNPANVALQGFDRINLNSGATTGGPADPRLYQTVINLSAILGSSNKSLASITFGEPAAVGATAIYAVSGQLSSQSNQFFAAVLTNLPASGITTTTATFGGQVLSTGGNTPTVTLYYGTTDGGTNAANWAQSLVLGPETGSFPQSISGLSSNTTYYYTARASNVAGISWAAPSLNFTTPATNVVIPPVAMLTFHNDNTRQGANTNEVQLNLTNVNVNTFGKLFTYALDGYVYAQPLVMTNVTIPGKGVHNVVYVVTEHDSIYALDADSSAGANSSPLWQVSFLNPGAGVTTVPAGDVGTSDITPEVGITATPVIDPVTATIYLEVKTKEAKGSLTNYVHRLHALDITTGAERTNGVVSNSPVVINCTNYPGTGTSGFTDNDGNGHVTFNTKREHSRPALTLVNGVLYLGFASHGDQQPYHGWLFSYDAHSLAQLSVFNSTPNGGLGGFWQGGGGATVDSNGNFYLLTGNGSFNATGATYNQTTNSFAMSVLKFSPTNGVLTLSDYFSPFNESSLSGGDADLGSGAAIVLPDSVGTVAHPHLLVAAGKAGPVYLLDRDNMGRFNAGNNSQIVQYIPSALATAGQNGSYMTPVYFNKMLYYIGMNNNLMAFSISNGAISSNSIMHTSTVYGDKGSSSPSLSANGTNNAIIWALESDAYASSGPEILHAYNATNLSQELYNSGMNQNRDGPGAAVKFATPTIVNGKVYVGAEFALSVFGANPFLTLPVISPNGGNFTNSITITLSDTTPGVSLYYTLDGTAPTTNSFLYSVPFALTNSANLHVVATKPGFVNSAIAVAGFVDSSSVGNGIGLLGQYWSNQVGTFNGSPSLTRTDAVVNFTWSSGGPDPKVGGSNYTVAWTGRVQPQFSENYTFSTSTDNGVRLTVNGQVLINQFSNQSPSIWNGSITLKAQQYYNIEMDYFHTTGSAGAELQWGSQSTPTQVIPQTQLYPDTNPAPVVVMTNPTNGAIFAGTASVTLSANAAAQYNALTNVSFYINGIPTAGLTNSPYTVTVTGLTNGNYTLTAAAFDTTGLYGTSAPVSITVQPGSGAPYGQSNLAATPAFFNMPQTFNGVNFSGMPTTLSATGVFTNTSNMAPFGGFVPYVPNVSLWSDGALKVRYLAIPNNGAPYTPQEQIAFAPTGTWTFPSGTVFVKTFELLTNTSDPNSILRLETRLLVRDTQGAVYGVTYKWRPDNSDADLLTTSTNQNVAITTTGGVVTQNWYYPSPQDCLTCHTPVANYVLGVNSRQLNANLLYPSSGNTDNQLRTLNRLGLLNPAINEANISNYEQMYAVTNVAATLESRARSYLDANCAQCHQPGGTGPTFDARYDTLLTNQNIIFGVLSKGDLGYDNAFVVTPEDIFRSVLYDRINTTNLSIQMPPLARNLIDTNAVAMFAAWINSLPGTPALAPPQIAPPGGVFNGSVNITLVPPATNATLYYTLDGSLPTTNSFLYGLPFTLASNATVSANAFAPGFVNSVASSAVFNIIPNALYVFPGALSNGTFRVQLTGVVGSNYIFQASTDFTNWVPLSTNLISGNPTVIIDSNASNFPYRYYRAIPGH